MTISENVDKIRDLNVKYRDKMEIPEYELKELNLSEILDEFQQVYRPSRVYEKFFDKINNKFLMRNETGNGNRQRSEFIDKVYNNEFESFHDYIKWNNYYKMITKRSV